MTAPFRPSHIYIEASVSLEPLTKKILAQFPFTPRTTVADAKSLKKPAAMTWAKKGLLLSRLKTDTPIKPFSANAQSMRRNYFSLNLASNCHLECTYCILQSYLANNPLITLPMNLGEILEKVSAQLRNIPEGSVVGTGHIADSLALEGLTGFHQRLIPIFAGQNRAVLEMKTKSDRVWPLLGLAHGGQTVVSWSMNPPSIAAREELKTAGISERLRAARLCAGAGYRVGFHFDPMILHDGWEKNYAALAEMILETIPPPQIAWISLGMLRFPARQAAVMKRRFPKSTQIHEGLRHTHLPFLTYAPAVREKMAAAVRGEILKRAPKITLYTCADWGSG